MRSRRWSLNHFSKNISFGMCRLNSLYANSTAEFLNARTATGSIASKDFGTQGDRVIVCRDVLVKRS